MARQRKIEHGLDINHYLNEQENKMKKLLIAFTLLGSLSSFASTDSCNVNLKLELSTSLADGSITDDDARFNVRIYKGTEAHSNSYDVLSGDSVEVSMPCGEIYYTITGRSFDSDQLNVKVSIDDREVKNYFNKFSKGIVVELDGPSFSTLPVVPGGEIMLVDKISIIE